MSTPSFWKPPARAVRGKEIVAGLYAVFCSSGNAKKVREIFEGIGTVMDESDAPGKIGQTLMIVRAKDSQVAEQTMESLMDKDMIDHGSPVLLDRASRLRQIVGDQIVVRFRQKRTISSLWEGWKQRYRFSVARADEFDPQQYTITMDHPRGFETLRTAELLAGNSLVEFAVPNYLSEFGR